MCDGRPVCQMKEDDEPGVGLESRGQKAHSVGKWSTSVMHTTMWPQ